MAYTPPDLNQAVPLRKGYAAPALSQTVLLGASEDSTLLSTKVSSPLGGSVLELRFYDVTRVQASASSPLGAPSVAIAEHTFAAVLAKIRSPLGALSCEIELYANLLAFASAPSPLGACQISVAVTQGLLLSGAISSPLGSSLISVYSDSAVGSVKASVSGPLGVIRFSLETVGAGGESDEPNPPAMVVISPQEITENELVFSSAEVTTLPLWSSTTCYPVGSQVRTANGQQWEAVYGKVESAQNRCRPIYNINRSPSTATISTSSCYYSHAGAAWWKEITLPSNHLRMFDPRLDTITSATGTLEVILKPTEDFDSIAIFAVLAKSVEVTITHPTGVVYSRVFDLAYSPQLFPAVKYKNVVADLGVPRYAANAYTNPAPVRLVFTGADGDEFTPEGLVEVGFLCLGLKESLGLACYETEIGIRDYSQKDRDAFGLPIIRKDAYSDSITYLFESDIGVLNTVVDTISKYRAKPVAYVGYEDREETCIFGLYESFVIPVENWAIATGVLTVKGLPYKDDTVYPDECDEFTGGKTIFTCNGNTPAIDCIDEEPVQEGEYGLCQYEEAVLVCGDSDAYITGLVDDVCVGLSGALFVRGQRHPLSLYDTHNYRGVVVGGGVIVAVGDNGVINVSTDGINFTLKESPYGPIDYAGAAYIPAYSGGRTLLCAYSSCGVRAFSTDHGETWIKSEDLHNDYACRCDDGDFKYGSPAVPFTGVAQLKHENGLFLLVLLTGDVYYTNGDELWHHLGNPAGDGAAILSDNSDPKRIVVAGSYSLYESWYPFSSWEELLYSGPKVTAMREYDSSTLEIAGSDGTVSYVGSSGIEETIGAGIGSIAPLPLWSVYYERPEYVPEEPVTPEPPGPTPSQNYGSVELYVVTGGVASPFSTGAINAALPGSVQMAFTIRKLDGTFATAGEFGPYYFTPSVQNSVDARLSGGGLGTILLGGEQVAARFVTYSSFNGTGSPCHSIFSKLWVTDSSTFLSNLSPFSFCAGP